MTTAMSFHIVGCVLLVLFIFILPTHTSTIDKEVLVVKMKLDQIVDGKYQMVHDLATFQKTPKDETPLLKGNEIEEGIPVSAMEEEGLMDEGNDVEMGQGVTASIEEIMGL